MIDFEKLRQWRKLRENAVNMDRWDREAWQRVQAGVPTIRAATNDMCEVLPTGAPLMADVLGLLYKAMPELCDRADMRPESYINHSVADETRGLTDYQTVRRFTRGDEVGAALQCAAMEPDIEGLVDRHQQRQEQADRLQQLMDDLAHAGEEQADLDEMIRRWTEDNPDDELPDDMAGQRADLAGIAEALEQEAQALVDELNDDSSERAQTRAVMALAMRDAAARLRDEATLGRMLWGTQPGALQRLDVNRRLELARKLDNDRLRRIIAKFGAIHNTATTERIRTNPTMKDEIVGVTLGRDLPRVLPSEFTKLRSPTRKHEFYRSYLEGTLPEFDFTGQERSDRGRIICTEDGSGSMIGEKEEWAKAFMTNMMDIARDEGRGFCLIHFGSATEISIHDFPNPASYTVTRIFEAIEIFFGGGTNFEVPLREAVKLLRAEFASTGHVDGDIVMLTDGWAGVTPAFLAWLKAEQAELGFKVWGLVMGVDRELEPLWSICEGNVNNIKDLAGGSDAAHIFRGV